MRTLKGAAVARACRGFLLSGLVAAAGVLGLADTARADGPAQVTVLFDAFGSDPALKKDWGFSALVEYGGKRILFDTGNNAEVFAHNVKAKGIDLTKLDFVVMSHRHGDHTSGLNHLLKVNPGVKIYAPQENFGCQSASNFDPLSACNIDPLGAQSLSRPRPELRSESGAAEGLAGGRGHERFLRRQLSLPVSTISQ